MIIKNRMNFALLNYSGDAVDQIISQSPGKPFFDENRKPIGTIVKAMHIPGTTFIEFEIETFTDFEIESKHCNTMSISGRRCSRVDTTLSLGTPECNKALEEYEKAHDLDRMDQIAIKVLKTPSNKVANLPELKEVDKMPDEEEHAKSYDVLSSRIGKIKSELNIN